MNVLSLLARVPARCGRVVAWTMGTTSGSMLAGRAVAQAVPSPVVPPSLSGSETHQVFMRLDPTAIAIVVVGAIIVLLLLLRIVQMIRRERVAPERPTVTGPRTRIPVERDETLERPTITATTDWGFDQNKRAATARSPVTVGRAAAGVSSLDAASTQWSESEVQNAAQLSMQPGESMGKPANLPQSPYRTSHNPYYRGETTESLSMEVEEVADVLLQAELLVQLGDPKQAMLLLSQHIRETEKPGPAVWLIAAQPLPDHRAKGPIRRASPRLHDALQCRRAPVGHVRGGRRARARKLCAGHHAVADGWPNAEVRPFLEQLLNDDRGGSRQGFSLAAYREILFLIEVLNVLDRMTEDDLERERIQLKLARPG